MAFGVLTQVILIIYFLISFVLCQRPYKFQTHRLVKAMVRTSQWERYPDRMHTHFIENFERILRVFCLPIFLIKVF